MAMAGADRIFRLMDEKEEEDEGYVTLVNAKEENGCTHRNVKNEPVVWAWKHVHQADDSVRLYRS